VCNLDGPVEEQLGDWTEFGHVEFERRYKAEARATGAYNATEIGQSFSSIV